MTRRPLFSAALAWLAGILILASGCMDQSPTAIVLEPATVSAFRSANSQAVSVQAIAAANPFAAGTASALITPQGGSIDFGIGTIDFPAGAVAEPTRITATVDGSTFTVEFGPHGLQFPAGAQPQLNFHYGEATLPADAAIFYVDDSGNVLENLGGSVDAAAGTISAALQHFSPYILGAS